MTVGEIDSKKFWQVANNKLAYFGAQFVQEIIVRSEGVYVYTNEGKKILDFTSGQMSCLVGHCHPEINKTIAESAATLDHTLSGMISPPVVDLAEKLTNLLPDGLDRVAFLSTGGESNEYAIKLAKCVTGKFEVVGLSLSWHGMTAAANACTYQAGRTGHGPMTPGALVLPSPNSYRSIFRNPDGTYDWKTELDYGWSLVDAQSTGSLACVIIEPVMSSGGMLILPNGYLQEMKKHCEKRGMLLIVDEAQTGVGRCGSMFAIEEMGVIPDILCLSKTLGNGLPLSAIITSKEIDDRSRERDFLFYTTHINDPIPAAVGSKVLDIVIRDSLVANSKARGKQLGDGLLKMMDSFKAIGDVRQMGLMIGLEIVKDRATKESDPEMAAALAKVMMKHGLNANLIAVKAFGGVFRMAPPISITENEVDEALAIIKISFEEVYN
ncbi:hypothetical protein PICMEDRAFT_18440 [Pichia membranifaciens NRRL Y-2026]|uniref:Uncharacterized protein n=1 Tax=Pichia membranifaciens NRRL Y-2026 TaxID=763406 RepID=A0A1E3NF26_9ASCO|nr:hypothetical protein PICMEDRAFT_18440 [Pichia membranifaciens NRRL Y-2026]ODQ44178.1 hypothetical protein PICMEDRAFT_18440 [Pichia membranifaciens NRRL Y-2026]